MAGNYHERLADIIVDEIKEARSEHDCCRAIKEITAISNALKVAEGRNRMECDLKRFMKKNKFYYSEDDINEIMEDLSKRIDKQVYFRTLTLSSNIESRLIKNLQPAQDLWETAKIIYALGTLYDDNKEKLSKVVYAIKDDMQRRNATIVAKVFFKGYEEVFDIFSLDVKI